MSCFEKNNYMPKCEVCPALGFQDVTVCLPVEICPFAEVGKVKTECLGKPVIKRGSGICECAKDSTCKFTVSQKMRIEVPVVFSANTEVGEAKIDCGCEHKHECGCHHCEDTYLEPLKKCC